MNPSDVRILPISSQDREWIPTFISSRWGSEIVIVHGTIYNPAELSGYFAVELGKIVGLVTYIIKDDKCEIVSLDSISPGRGIGSRLIDAVKKTAIDENCKLIWLITTNDNLDGLRFYQRRGFQIIRIYPNAVIHSRAKKPSIPLIGEYGIPIRDELELVMYF
ncbi:MAG: GNAT family N-acetyltransferase [Anaerolineaceae bacterium]|nr:GNAT family N-acetyltransferase [Anaerolineaceae bacterium]